MKSNQKRKIITLLFLGTVLTLSPLSIYYLVFVARTGNYTDAINVENENLKVSKISVPIYISGNSGWIVANSTGICNGSGTSSDPYVIEDLVIDGGGSSNCILIENSDVYFRIENCTLYDSGSTPDHSGILLKQTINGQLINNNCSYNRFGINFDSNCYNCTIQGNTITYNTEYGINLMISSYNEIKENTVNYNGNMGINLEPESPYNEIINNTVNFNYWLGIHLEGNSGNNLILFNDCSNNMEGISVRTPNNTISKNIVKYNSGKGIHLWKAHSYDNTQSNNITRNLINSNADGIRFSGKSSYNIIEGNRISDNTEKGFLIETDCHENLIFNNTYIDNNVNARDDGTDNQWDNGTLGNYWSDYSGKDANDNGIGDTPYKISGTANSRDNFPIWDDGLDDQKKPIPGYNLLFLLGIISVITVIIIKKVRKL